MSILIEVIETNIKVGDKVKIVDSTHINIHPDAKKFLGTVVTIEEIGEVAGYRIKEDNGQLIWDESIFEKVLSLPDKRKEQWKNLIALTKEADIY